MKKIFKEYKQFAVKGNVLDMAVGIVVGGAFATLATSLVANVIAPLLGLFTSGVDLADLFIVLREGTPIGPYLTLEQANKAGAVTLSYGLFLNGFFSFLIVSWIAFLFVKGLNNLRANEIKEDNELTKKCPFCYSKIHIKATKCAACTADISEALDSEQTP